ncbi:MAG: hypothetical protein RL701_5996 [Pseudomonadota bacterium]
MLGPTLKLQSGKLDVAENVVAGVSEFLRTNDGTMVRIADGPPPTSGQVLTASDDTHASWQDPSGGGGGAITEVVEGTGINVTGGTGPTVTVSAEFGTTSGTIAQGNDSRLTNARTPTAHASTHLPGGTDALTTAAPVALTVGGSNAAGVAASFTRSDHAHALPAFGTGAGTFAQGNDARFADARVPTAHATTHQDGGSDELNVGGLSGVLADPQPPIIGATGTTAVAGNDSRLTNARTPTAHAASHQDGGADEISVTGLSGVLADPQPPIIGSGAAQAVAGNDSRLTNSRAPSGSATGDLSGTYPAPSVAIVGGVAAATIAANLPATAEKAALAGSSGTPGSGNKYVTDADARNTNSRAPSGSASGDLGNSYPSPKVVAVTETSGPTQLTIGSVTVGQILIRSGSTLIGTTPSPGTVGLGGSKPLWTIPTSPGTIDDEFEGTAGTWPSGWTVRNLTSGTTLANPSTNIDRFSALTGANTVPRFNLNSDRPSWLRLQVTDSNQAIYVFKSFTPSTDRFYWMRCTRSVPPGVSSPGTGGGSDMGMSIYGNSAGVPDANNRVTIAMAVSAGAWNITAVNTVAGVTTANQMTAANLSQQWASYMGIWKKGSVYYPCAFTDDGWCVWPSTSTGFTNAFTPAYIGFTMNWNVSGSRPLPVGNVDFIREQAECPV